MAETQFIKTRVILPVADIYDTIDWFKRALGFHTDYIHGNGRRGENPDFANYAIMSCDKVEVHFIMDEGGAVWTRAGTGHLGLIVRDVDTLYAAIRAKKLPVARGLQDESWPARGFHLKDPSGNEIHIEQPL